MKIAVLINHNTAAKFYCEIFKKLNIEVYIPLYCSIEKNTLEYNEVLKYRTIKKYNFINTLDDFDFYNKNQKNKVVEDIYNILINNFNCIITLHPINNYLNLLLSLSNNLIYFIMWGDTCIINHYKYIHNNILNTSNKYYLFCHDFLLNNFDIELNIPQNKIKYAPLGLPPLNCNKNTNLVRDNKDVLIIISRLHLFGDLVNLILYLAKELPEINFNIVGKNNLYNFTNIKNVIIHNTFEKEDELYNFIQNFNLNININPFNHILQYSAVEIAYFNIPNLYRKNSTLDRILNFDNYFVYDTNIELVTKIRNLILNKKLNEYLEISRLNNQKLYEKYKFENLIDYYIKLLNLQD